MTSFTPGPWSAGCQFGDKRQILIEEADGLRLCIAECRAVDADIISAAPIMYAALCDSLLAIEKGLALAPESYHLQSAGNIIRDAIVKAKGERQ